jgi:RIO-like serine/threonine protein kinase
MDAYKAGFLHRDFSPGNVIMTNGKGLLIDWDLSKPLSEELETPRRATRTVFTY